MAHAIPWYSAFTAITELVVTAAVFYVLYTAVRQDRFHGRLLGAALAYEVLFNISYMTVRLFTHTESDRGHADWMVALLAGHGALSLVMFVGLVALSIAAYRAHVQGDNFFKRRLGLTASFAVLWTISILSGEAIFLLEYVGHH